MSCSWIAGRWIQAGLIGLSGSLGLLHLVADFEDYTLSPVLAEAFLVFALDDREGLHDVVGVIARDAVKMKECGIEFAANQKPTFLIPAK